MDRDELARLADIADQMDVIDEILAELLAADPNQALDVGVTYPQGHAKEGSLVGDVVQMRPVDVSRLLGALRRSYAGELEAGGVRHGA